MPYTLWIYAYNPSQSSPGTPHDVLVKLAIILEAQFVTHHESDIIAVEGKESNPLLIQSHIPPYHNIVKRLWGKEREAVMIVALYFLGSAKKKNPPALQVYLSFLEPAIVISFHLHQGSENILILICILISASSRENEQREVTRGPRWLPCKPKLPIRTWTHIKQTK